MAENENEETNAIQEKKLSNEIDLIVSRTS